MAKYTNISNLKVIFYEGHYLKVVDPKETIESKLIPNEVAKYFVEIHDDQVSLPKDVFVVVEEPEKSKRRAKKGSEED